MKPHVRQAAYVLFTIRHQVQPEIAHKILDSNGTDDPTGLYAKVIRDACKGVATNG